MTDLQNDLEFSAKIDEWYKAAQQAAHWTETEKRLRAEIFNTAFPKPTPGTNKVRIAHQMALVGDYRINYRIDRPGLEASRSLIPVDVFEAVVNYRPEIKDGAYRKLDMDTRKLFSPFVTETPGTPGLEIKAASKVRW